jgi:hypothetical protein
VNALQRAGQQGPTLKASVIKMIFIYYTRTQTAVLLTQKQQAKNCCEGAPNNWVRYFSSFYFDYNLNKHHTIFRIKNTYLDLNSLQTKLIETLISFLRSAPT